MHSKQVIAVSYRLTEHAVIVTSMRACNSCLGGNMCAICLLSDNYEPVLDTLGILKIFRAFVQGLTAHS